MLRVSIGQQLIIHDPLGSAVRPVDTVDNAQNIAPDGSLMAGTGSINGVVPPPYFDPPKGGYVPPVNFGTFNPFPFFYYAPAPATECTSNGGCPPSKFVVSVDGSTLS